MNIPHNVDFRDYMSGEKDCDCQLGDEARGNLVEDVPASSRAYSRPAKSGIY